MPPHVYGPSLRFVSEQKSETRWPCPVPEYSLIKSVQRVANWACGGMYEAAEKMRIERPALYTRILLLAEAEAEAEPEAIKYANKESERKRKPQELAQQAQNGAALTGTKLTG